MFESRHSLLFFNDITHFLAGLQLSPYFKIKTLKKESPKK